ncbi:hypothetical protein SANA_20180 [Gottschalkiaceae bacterium SANA]|nr:hypothetical protein SANA_20180 [Gottschalkiaceae bacterium SANA]
MFYSTKNINNISSLFDDVGLNVSACSSSTALIKINLARIPVKNHPRSSVKLIKEVVLYLKAQGVSCTLAEAADGYLRDNLEKVGLSEFIDDNEVGIIDLDLEEVVEIVVGDEIHYYPKCLCDYDLRIAIPATSKRPNCIFSNNVKLFVGIVPRKYYQMGEPVRHRIKIHLDLHKSLSNIYKGLMEYAPFHYYINGGLAMKEGYGEFQLPIIYIGNNAVELDKHVLLEHFNIEIPEYLLKISHD